MVHDPSMKSAYAPAGYETSGIVKYYNQGATFIIEKRRNDAFSKMHTSCSGKYKILKEYIDTYSTGSSTDYSATEFGVNSSTSNETASYVNFDFACI